MTFALLNLLRSAPGSAAVATDNKSRTSGRRDLFPGNFIFVLYPVPHTSRAGSRLVDLWLFKKTPRF